MARRLPPDVPSDLNSKKYGPLALHLARLWQAVKDLAGGDPKPHAKTHQVGGSDALLLPGAPATLRLNLVADTGDGPGFAREDHVHRLDALLDEKGAILSHDGTVYVKVAPGTPSDGDVLTWDSAEPASFKWAPATGGGGGGSATAIFDLVENKDLAAPATSLTFSGLDGDTDEVYFLKYKIIKGVAATILTTLRPNGITTNQATRGEFNGTAVGNINTTTLEIAGNGSVATGGVETGHVWIDAKTGVRRTGRGEWVQSDGGTLIFIDYGFHWDETATNITSIDVVCDQANGLAAGSYFRLYKLRKVSSGSAGDSFARPFALMGA
jgi:hypothetical protein